MSVAWKIVAAIFIILTFTSGLGFYIQSILVQGLIANGFSIELASSGISVFFLSTGIAGLLVGRLLELIDIRWIFCVGAVIVAGALMAIGRVSNAVELYLAYIFFGIGYSATSILPATTLISRWFKENQSRAMSIAMTGLSFGGLLLTPLSAALVQQYGLTHAVDGLALLLLVGVVPVSLLYLKSFPGGAADSPASQAQLTGIDYHTALRQHFFWGFTFVYVLVMIAQVGSIAHQYGVLTERLSVSQASMGVAIMPLFSIVGRLLGGLALEFISTLRFTIFMMVVQGLALVVIGSATSIYWLYGGLALFGSATGNVLMLQALVISEVYGARHYSRLFSLSNMLMVCGFSLGPFLMGWLQSMSGDYSLSFWFAGSFCVAGAVILGTIRPPAQKASSNP